MNRKRRKKISDIIIILEACIDSLQNVMNEEQDALDNIPESLQYSDKGNLMEDAIDTLQNACDQIDEVANELRQL